VLLKKRPSHRRKIGQKNRQFSQSLKVLNAVRARGSGHKSNNASVNPIFESVKLSQFICLLP
jgi:hypothetical protein